MQNHGVVFWEWEAKGLIIVEGVGENCLSAAPLHYRFSPGARMWRSILRDGKGKPRVAIGGYSALGGEVAADFSRSRASLQMAVFLRGAGTNTA